MKSHLHESLIIHVVKLVHDRRAEGYVQQR